MSKQRRIYSAEFKLDTVLEGLRGEKPVAQICRERSIKDTLYDKGRAQFQRHASEIFVEGGHPPMDEAQEAQIAELERARPQGTRRLTLANEALKKRSAGRVPGQRETADDYAAPPGVSRDFTRPMAGPGPQ